jgi:hypothetical protein
MAGRIAKVRGELRAALESRCPEKDWSFVTKQIGMFSYTGMSPQQVGAVLGARPRGWWGCFPARGAVRGGGDCGPGEDQVGGF